MKGDFKVCKVSLKCIHKQIQENDFFLTNGNAKRIVKLTTVSRTAALPLRTAHPCRRHPGGRRLPCCV